MTSATFIDLIDGMIGPDDDPRTALSDLKKVEGLVFDGSKCATCKTNCCIVTDEENDYIVISENELEVIYRAYPDAPKVKAQTKGQGGRRYYTVEQKGGRCAFLGNDFRCTVYSARPRYCREFPGSAYQLHGLDGVAYDLERCPGTTYSKPVLCLSSGGIDSLVLHAHLKERGFTPYALFIDYGQPSVKEERRAARQIAAHYGGKFYVERVKLDLWSQLPHAGVAQQHFVFFSVAASYCDMLNIPRLGLSWRGKDLGKSVRTYRSAALAGSTNLTKMAKQFRVILPLRNMTKSQIASMGRKCGAPFQLAAQ